MHVRHLGTTRKMGYNWGVHTTKEPSSRLVALHDYSKHAHVVRHPHIAKRYGRDAGPRTYDRCVTCVVYPDRIFCRNSRTNWETHMITFTSSRPTAAVLLLWLCMGAQASAVPLSDGDFKVDVVKSMSRSVLADRLKGALWGVYIGDALAMPAHWYYDISQLRTDHGVIRGYVAAKTHMRGSILNLSNTGGGGRGGDSGTIVGDVINHGKRKYWKRGADYFYHQGLRAGENTLEAHVTRVLARSIADRGKYDPDAFLEGYVKFMTTPGAYSSNSNNLSVVIEWLSPCSSPHACSRRLPQ